MKSPTDNGTVHLLWATRRKSFAPREIGARRRLHARRQQRASERKHTGDVVLGGARMKERCRYGGPSLLPVLGWAQLHVITALGVSFTAAAADRLLECSALLLPSYSLGSFIDLRTSASLRTFRLLQRFQVPWLLAGSCRGLAVASVLAPLCAYN
jgi:hypothetical protein